MTVNFTLVISAYKRYQNIYNLLHHFTANSISFNKIVIVHDKIDYIDEASIVVYKSKLQTEFTDITHITHSKHLGVAGIIEVAENLKDEEFYLWLEDDLWAELPFFDQCNDFISKHFTSESPIFIGYSKTQNTHSSFFKTYMCIPMWSVLTKGKYLKSFTSFYRNILANITEKKDYILYSKVNCDTFEKYKHSIFKINSDTLTVKPHNLDFYFLIFLVANKFKVIKNTKCYVTVKEKKYAVNSTKDVEINPNYSELENDLINGMAMWD